MVSAPITTWYYEYYEPGAFPHQRELCEKIARTKCNLEGQRPINHDRLTGERANPLTIRLYNIQDKLKELEKIVEDASSRISRYVEAKFNRGEIAGIHHSLVTSSSTGTFTAGAPTEKIELDGVEEALEINTFKPHVLLYELFTNFGSVLDRLAFEINLLYNLRVHNVNWSKLVDIRPSNDKYFKALRNKDAQLADLIVSFSSKLKKTIGYRNRLVHDGIIRVYADINFTGLNLMLAEDPNDNQSQMSLVAIDFCKKARLNILKVLDESYRLMLKHLQSHGNPPW